MRNSLLILVLMAMMAGGCIEDAPMPNILIFLADDLGYGDLGCYGNPIIRTPHIDKLAAEGVRLTDCHSGGTVCSPSRSALLTGRNPYRSGFFYISGGETHLHDDEVTIAEILQAKGYETSFWGKWHLSYLEKGKGDQPGPWEQGFETWMGTTVNAFDGPANPGKFIRNGKAVGKVEGWYCDVIVDEACDWLRNGRNPDQPFFMYVASHEPHTPIAPPPDYSQMYDSREVDDLEKGIEYGGVKRPEEDISAFKKEYYGTVTQLDEAFGRLMSTLEELDLEKNTLVVFTSDNGPETPVTLEESLGEWDDPIRDKCFGTPGKFRGMKRYPYEGGHRVPGIARFPGVIPQGTESGILLNGCDFLPTFCNLVDASVPADRPIDGIDAFGALLNEEVEREVPVIWFYPHHGDTYFRMPQMAMRKDGYTLVGWLPEKPDALDLMDWMTGSDPQKFELYDLASDPYQTEDISEREPQMVAALQKEMIRHWREMRDEGLVRKK